MIGVLAVDLGLVIAFLLLGFLLVRAILGRVHLVHLVALSFPLGAGVLSFALFILSWAGMRLTPASAVGTYVALVALALPFQPSGHTSRDALSGRERGRDSAGPLKVAVLGLVTLVVLMAFVLSVGQSYSAWDAIAIWSVKGYGIAKEGTVFAAQEWGAHGLAYPLNIPILVSLFKMLDGDVLPGSKLIFPAFYGSLIATCYWFWRRRGLEDTLAAAGALFLAALPAVFEYGTNGYANQPFSCYIVLGTLALIDALLGNAPRELILSGSMFGLACWTRPEGVFMVPIVALAVILSARVRPRQWASVGLRFVPLLVFAGPWVLFSRTYPTQDHMAQAFVAIREALANVEVKLGAFYWIGRYGARQAIEPSSWGIMVPVMAFFAIFRLTRPTRRILPAEFVVLVAALAACASMIGFYYIVSLIGDVTYWLGTGVDRMFQAVGILMGVFTVLFAGVSLGQAVAPEPRD